MKTKQSQIDAIEVSLTGLTDKRLVLITAVAGGVSETTLQDPSNWTEASQFATTNRPDLDSVIPAVSEATDQGAYMLLESPTVDVDLAAVSGSGFTVVAAAIVDGTGALGSTTTGRVSDIADKTYAVGDIIRLSDFSWDTTEK